MPACLPSQCDSMNWHSKKEDTQDETRDNHGGERGQYSDTQGKTPDGTLSGSRLHSPVQHHDLDGTEADDPLDAPSREFHVHVGPGIGSAELESGGGQGAEKAIRILRPSYHVGAKEEEKRAGDQKDQPFPVRARRDWNPLHNVLIAVNHGHLKLDPKALVRWRATQDARMGTSHRSVGRRNQHDIQKDMCDECVDRLKDIGGKQAHEQDEERNR
jgi:hypothetical protein